jgi:hypothetical protein
LIDHRTGPAEVGALANLARMPGNPLSDPNWAADTADTIDRLVGSVREKAITPVVHATRAVVFGLLAIFLGLTIVTLLLLTVTRAFQELLDVFVTPPQAVYLSYLIVGGILCLGGAILMRMRAPKSST